jgi:hypothetical protein
VVVVISNIDPPERFGNGNINWFTGLSLFPGRQGNLTFKNTVGRKNLYPSVARIGYIHTAGGVCGNTNGDAQFPFPSTFATERKLKISLFIKNVNPIVYSVHYVYLVVLPHGNISRL